MSGYGRLYGTHCANRGVRVMQKAFMSALIIVQMKYKKATATVEDEDAEQAQHGASDRTRDAGRAKGQQHAQQEAQHGASDGNVGRAKGQQHAQQEARGESDGNVGRAKGQQQEAQHGASDGNVGRAMGQQQEAQHGASDGNGERAKGQQHEQTRSGKAAEAGVRREQTEKQKNWISRQTKQAGQVVSV